MVSCLDEIARCPERVAHDVVGKRCRRSVLFGVCSEYQALPSYCVRCRIFSTDPMDTPETVKHAHLLCHRGIFVVQEFASARKYPQGFWRGDAFDNPHHTSQSQVQVEFPAVTFGRGWQRVC